MKSLRSFYKGNPTSLEEIIEISSNALPGWDEFLEEWIEYLKHQTWKEHLMHGLGRLFNLKQGIY